MDQSISRIIDEAIANQTFPGAVVGYLKDDKKQLLAFGHHSYAQGSPKVQENTTYDVASITKSIPTSSLILWLIDQSKLSLDTLVSDLLPEMQGAYRGQLNIWHLLTYTAVFDLNGRGLSDYARKGVSKLFEVIYAGKLSSPPGSAYFYTNTPAILLGVIAERVFGKSLNIAANEVFFEPLNMGQTTLTPDLFPAFDFAPTEVDSWRGKLQAQVHDESAWTLAQAGRCAGNAGLFSTASDLLTFARMLVNNGSDADKRYFSDSMLEKMHTNQIAKLGLSTGLGWELNQETYMGKYAASLFGKTGFTGCVILIHPRLKRAMVVLSNYTYPKRKPDKVAINKVRSSLADIVFAP
ncbi:MAG TPA: serine hydrolase domain-containing protein [Candidatus Saccharimonadales bacterium]|jgi:CubicO group peptidase (beta-lactamase class C family)